MRRKANADHGGDGAEVSAAPARRQLPPEVQETVKIMVEVMADSRRRELAAQAEADRRPRRRSLLASVSLEARARVMKTVSGWPTLAEAAAMLGIAETALPPDVQTLGRGPRLRRRVPPGEVIELARLRGRREVEYVAADLVQYAVEHAPQAAGEVHDQADRVMAATAPRPRVSPDSFLAIARWYLPPELCRSVVAAVRSRVRQEERLRKRPAGERGLQAAPPRQGDVTGSGTWAHLPRTPEGGDPEVTGQMPAGGAPGPGRALRGDAIGEPRITATCTETALDFVTFGRTRTDESELR